MKKTRFYSIFKAKCPVCREGEVFDTTHFYTFKNMDKMHTNCSKCGHKFEKEVGFWYGAMFVSYAFIVALSVATFVLTFLIYPAATAWVYIAAITLMAFFMAPITFRISRMIWMNMFSKYDPQKVMKHEQI